VPKLYAEHRHIGTFACCRFYGTPQEFSFGVSSTGQNCCPSSSRRKPVAWSLELTFIGWTKRRPRSQVVLVLQHNFASCIESYGQRIFTPVALMPLRMFLGAL
jgi:hypothetical protein